jgi:hypothetical protein
MFFCKSIKIWELLDMDFYLIWGYWNDESFPKKRREKRSLSYQILMHVWNQIVGHISTTMATHEHMVTSTTDVLFFAKWMVTFLSAWFILHKTLAAAAAVAWFAIKDSHDVIKNHGSYHQVVGKRHKSPKSCHEHVPQNGEQRYID